MEKAPKSNLEESDFFEGIRISFRVNIYFWEGSISSQDGDYAMTQRAWTVWIPGIEVSEENKVSIGRIAKICNGSIVVNV